MRLPNGFGSVYRMTGKRHNPWGARVSAGKKIDPKTQKVHYLYKHIGSFRTKKEAIEALTAWHENPYRAAEGQLTFAQVFERWMDDPLSSISDSMVKSWRSAFYACEPIHNLPMAALKVDILEKTMVEARNKKGEPATLHMKNRIKGLYNKLYEYALRHEIVSKDYARIVKSPGKPKPMIKRTPFTAKERRILFDNVDFPYVPMVLIGIYSGWRPSELCDLRTENIDLENGIMRGGMKTEAGINRIVPIHSKIFPIMQALYNPDCDHLFTLEDHKTPLDYNAYLKRWNKIKKRFGMDHRPHDTRHTFITMAKECEMNEWILKKIVGHETQDVTEAIYTHRTIDDLKKEIEKINI